MTDSVNTPALVESLAEVLEVGQALYTHLLELQQGQSEAPWYPLIHHLGMFCEEAEDLLEDIGEQAQQEEAGQSLEDSIHQAIANVIEEVTGKRYPFNAQISIYETTIH